MRQAMGDNGTGGHTGNSTLLRVLITIFRIERREICKACNVSPAYLSRILNEEGFGGSDRFWAALNNALPDLISPTIRQTFSLSSNAIGNADGIALLEFAGERAA